MSYILGKAVYSATEDWLDRMRTKVILNFNNSVQQRKKQQPGGVFATLVVGGSGNAHYL